MVFKNSAPHLDSTAKKMTLFIIVYVANIAPLMGSGCLSRLDTKQKNPLE